MADDEKPKKPSAVELARIQFASANQRRQKENAGFKSRLRRRAQVAILEMKGKKVREIAEILSTEDDPVSTRTVYRDSAFGNAFFLRQILTAKQEAYLAKIAELEITAGEAYDAWNQSRGVKVKHTQGLTAKGPVDYTTAEESPGNPAFLKIVLDCAREIRELLKVSVDPQLVGDLQKSPDAWFLECKTREDVEAMKSALTFEELAQKIRNGEIAALPAPEATEE